MEVTINGKQYAFVMNGTIGPLYVAQRLLGTAEQLDLVNNNFHSTVLWYAVLTLSNEAAPRFDEFVACLTSKMANELGDYVAQRWRELEGIQEDHEGDDEKKK